MKNSFFHKLFGTTPGVGVQPKEAIAYSITGIGQNFICTIIGSYLTIFLTDALLFGASDVKIGAISGTMAVAYLMLATRIFDAFNDPIIVNAVRWHTTGHIDMTLTEKLLYLADYIDESRSFESCVILRRYFWGANPEQMALGEREALLRDTLILSFDMTMKDLLADGNPISVETAEARNALLLERSKAER